MMKAEFKPSMLSPAGRLSVRDGNTTREVLVKVDEPILRVPQLAIHLSEDRKGVTLDPQRHVNAIWGVGNSPRSFVSYVADNGVRAVEHWRQIVANFHMVGVRQQVSLSRFREFGDDGLALLDRRDGELDTLFDQLESMAATLAA